MRRTQAITALAGLVAGILVLLAPAAGAQSSGAGACTVLTGTTDVGTVTVGQTFRLQLAPTCAFTVGATLTVSVNGVTIPGKVAASNGAVVVTITVVSATQLSVDDPVTVPARCGVNTAIATGPSDAAGGQNVSQTANFTIACPGTPAAPAATPILGRLSLTGANVARLAAAALALLMAGGLLVVAARRRSGARL